MTNSPTDTPDFTTAITRDEIDAAVRAWHRSSAISHEGRMAEALNAARKAVRVRLTAAKEARHG